jgi:hypothetical protein
MTLLVLKAVTVSANDNERIWRIVGHGMQHSDGSGLFLLGHKFLIPILSYRLLLDSVTETGHYS